MNVTAQRTLKGMYCSCLILVIVLNSTRRFEGIIPLFSTSRYPLGVVFCAAADSNSSMAPAIPTTLLHTVVTQ